MSEENWFVVVKEFANTSELKLIGKFKGEFKGYSKEIANAIKEKRTKNRGTFWIIEKRGHIWIHRYNSGIPQKRGFAFSRILYTLWEIKQILKVLKLAGVKVKQ